MSQTNPASQGQAGPNESVSLLDLIQPTHCSVECLRFFQELLASRPDPTSNQVEFTSPKFLVMLWQHILKIESLTHGAGGDNPFRSPESLPKPETWEEALDRIQENPPSLSEGHLAEIRLTLDLAEVLVAARNLAKPPQPKVYLAHLLAAFVFRIKEGSGLLPDLPSGVLGPPAIQMITFFRARLCTWVKSCDEEHKAEISRWIGLLNHALNGTSAKLDREASQHEDALDVDRYARALAMLIESADDKEFTLGIFGHWGRGKTHLMRRTQDVLENRKSTPKDRRPLTQYLQGACRTVMAAFVSPGSARPREFSVINFSAWRYPSRPEVWAHLHETVVERALQEGLRQSIPIVLRAGIERSGGWGFACLWLLLMAACIPWPLVFDLRDSLQWVINPITALMALPVFGWLKKSGFSLLKELRKGYLKPSSHAEKLGLRAAIGKDLTALLKGWMPSSGHAKTSWRPWWLTLLLCLPFFLALAVTWLFVGDLQSWPYHLGSLPGMGLFGLTYLGFRWIFPLSQPNRKCVLVVDDLDRCEPDHLLSVMESVKLMLEDKEVSCRMMACMLVDGDILGHAIWKKYGELAQNNRDHAKLNTKFDHTRIIRENIEKLFTVYFRLAELKERDVQSLVKKFGTTNSTVVAPATISPTQQKEPNKGHGVAPAQIESQSVNVTPAKLYIDDPESLRSAIKPHSIITLTDSERQAVEAALFLYLKEKPETLLVGPRSVRAFIFRYQLVRLIFEKRGIVDFDPSDVISKLAEKTFGAASTKPKSSDAISEVDAVLEMVT